MQLKLKNSKSTRITVFLEPELYKELMSMVSELKIPIKSESEAARYAIQQFLEYELNVKLTIELMKKQLDKQKQQIEADTNKIQSLQADNNRLFTEKQQLEIEAEQLRNKLKELKNEAKTGKRKKKSK